MDMLNSNPKETEKTEPVPDLALASSVPASVPAPVASTPEATAAPAVIPAPAPGPAAKVEIPQTKGSTPGGWNRFAGYNPNAAKNKQKDGRGGSKGHR
ncbi:MAG TPA: hypothetical protein VIJ93_08070 [bacterium]